MIERKDFSGCAALAVELAGQSVRELKHDLAGAQLAEVLTARWPRLSAGVVMVQVAASSARRSVSERGLTASRSVTLDARPARGSSQSYTIVGRLRAVSRSTHPMALRMKNSLSSSIAVRVPAEALEVARSSTQWDEQRQRRGAPDPEVIVDRPTIEYGSRRRLALDDWTDDRGRQPIDKRPRPCLAQQTLQQRHVATPEQRRVKVEQLDRCHAMFVDRGVPKNPDELHDVVVAQVWMAPLDASRDRPDRGHGHAVVFEVALQVRLLVGRPLRCAA